jgi:predicted dienelactone hydrolase
MFGETGLARVNVPVLAIGGTSDMDSPYAWGTHLTYESVASSSKVEVGLQGAQHMIFTGSCQTRRRLMTLVPEPFCADPVWNRIRAHKLVRHFATAFLLAELNHDVRASRALTSDAPEFLGVTVRAQGY